MAADLRLDNAGPFRRAALVRDGDLTDLHIDRVDRPSPLGAVIRGRVVRLAAGLDAAFVDIGDRQPALLNAADVRPRVRDARIGQLLRAGQEVTVQVKADAHGDKGAVVTMDVALPGRFLVHTPLGDGVHLSKRLGRGPERARLQQLVKAAAPPGGGWIVRADAAGADPALIAAEAHALWAAWRDALAATGDVRLPSPSAWERALVELSGRAGSIRALGPEALAAVRRWCADRAPDLLDRLAPHKSPHPLFEEDDLEGQIAALLEPRVPLSDGGSLVIERTEAMTVIDVNGGERGNALACNLDACREIARQLRLRNVGGIVVVDFINLANAAERERIELALSHAVSDDPAGTHVYGMTKLGLMEMTRSRRGPALFDLLRDPA